LAPTVAVLEKRGRFMVAQPVFERGRGVSLDSAKGAGLGDLVLLGAGKRGVRVARRIGRPDVARDVLEGLMLERGLRRSFPRVVEDEATDVAQDPPAEPSPRRDLTDLPTFTIDPATARDYDDAISARREGDAVRVWVHIADVSAYVRPGSVLERETLRRATSVYVPGAVEPMLPHALSSGACSLVSGQERLAVSVELEMAGAAVRSVAFHRSRIRSDARLTYPQVDAIFAGSERAEDPWAEPLALAREVAAAVGAKREERGSLAVESAEPVFEFDDRGHVVGVHHEEQTESHKVIEELMILANEQVAEHLSERRVPTLYRVHEKPDPRGVERLAEQLESLDVPTPPLPERMSPQQAGEAAGAISHAIARYVRSSGRGRLAFGTLVLRAMKQAFYSPRNIGHAGLASPRYCHFTSPIRRYPDLVAHRALLSTIGADDVPPRADDLLDAGEHSSHAEREAMQVERAADDVCMCFLLERRLAEAGWELELDGEVVGVIGKGLFVKFGEEGFEGFLPVRRMRGDWWDLNEQETALVGADSGRRIRIGDPLRVAVARVDPPRGRADLELAAD
ncbi:MAG: RNB domain-containing ribonuclease, partial [Actinomycetota bacterium]|nr:RNB domain-containing ribonuclease [Actinomycetota bacterium]